MSWLFSQALVAAYSADTCSDGEQSVPSNGNPTQQAYCAPDKMTAFSRLSRFGMTFKPLTEDRGEALLTSYLAAFPARTSAPPARAPASTASAPACGATWPELSVKYCLDSSSWKTHRSLWEEVLPWSSVTLPRWGMTQDGFVLAHPASERPISVTVSGLWPTPVKSDCVARRPTAGWDGTSDLVSVVWTRSGGAENPEKPPAKLNADWVEWLMGWPLGWTDLRPLETDRFQEWLQQHSPSLPRSTEESA